MPAGARAARGAQHWPDRSTNMFDTRAYKRSAERPAFTPFDETVGAIGELLAAGKVKQWGISNENAVGVCKLLESCAKLGVQSPVTIQNDFSVLHRRVEEDGTVEACSPVHSAVTPNGILLLACAARARAPQVDGGARRGGRRPPRAPAATRADARDAPAFDSWLARAPRGAVLPAARPSGTARLPAARSPASTAATQTAASSRAQSARATCSFPPSSRATSPERCAAHESSRACAERARARARRARASERTGCARSPFALPPPPPPPCAPPCPLTPVNRDG